MPKKFKCNVREKPDLLLIMVALNKLNVRGDDYPVEKPAPPGENHSAAVPRNGALTLQTSCDHTETGPMEDTGNLRK